jgi:FkbM family methyltransferase
MKILRKAFERVYLSVMRRRYMIKFNDLVLKLALRARGFNNFRNLNESGERYFIDALLRPLNPKLCVDVGANVGDYSEELLNATASNVIAFEPLTICQPSLSRIQLQHPSRLTVIQKAVSDKDGTAQIHFDAGATAHASLSEDVKQISYVNNGTSTTVETIALDSYFESNSGAPIDLLKIDTEGFEFEVLRGAQKLIANNPPRIIQIEFNLHQLFRNQSLLTLSKLLPGYLVYQLCDGRIVRRDPSDTYANIFQFSNYIFVCAEIATKFPDVLRPLNQ